MNRISLDANEREKKANLLNIMAINENKEHQDMWRDIDDVIARKNFVAFHPHSSVSFEMADLSVEVAIGRVERAASPLHEMAVTGRSRPSPSLYSPGYVGPPVETSLSDIAHGVFSSKDPREVLCYSSGKVFFSFARRVIFVLIVSHACICICIC